VLRRIVDMFGDAASISVLDGRDVVYVAHVSRQRMARMSAGVGVVYPAQLTSMGRVLLSHLPPERLEAYFAVFVRLKPTARTIAEPQELRAEIAHIRECGFAIAIDQLDHGVAAIAVPIRDPHGKVIAAMNSSGYTGLLTRQAMIEERLPELRASAATLTQVLRRHPALLHSLTPAWPVEAPAAEANQARAR
jgi:IclR family pca regulon transcriptional regulator